VKVCLALIVLLTAAVLAFAQTDSDTNGSGTSHGFSVSDGDTVKFGKQRIRLFGIDAPEKAQPCDDGQWYPGPLATKALVDFIAGRPVSCHQVDLEELPARRGLLRWQGRPAGADGKCRLGVGLYSLQ
jgi:endonuclease YncB( thermonuclease family)